MLGAPLAERLPIVRVQANEHRGWEMVPGETHYTYQHEVRVNALGLRGEELQPKRPGERRVLALGDSLVYGQGVAEDETLPFHLERLLNEGAGETRWDVVNAGHRAYDTQQELGLYLELRDTLDADDVVIFWYWNDIHERDIPGTNERLTASGPIHFDTGNTLEGLDRWAWRGKEALRRSALVMALWDAFAAKQGQDTDAGEDYLDAAFERLENYLERFARRTAETGQRLFFAPIPDAGSLLGDHPSEALLERAVGTAEALGVPVLDLRPELQALSEERGSPPVLPFDGHYLPEGNAALAAAAARALRP